MEVKSKPLSAFAKLSRIAYEKLAPNVLSKDSVFSSNFSIELSNSSKL
jgi:hypothetical protein